MRSIFYLFIIVYTFSCRAQSDKDYSLEFKKKQGDYFRLIAFLNKNKEIIIKPKCDKMFKSLAKQNEEGCFPTIKDSMSYFINKKIFESFQFYQDKSIELLLRTDNNPDRDKETKYYFVYSFSDSLPSIYAGWKVMKKLNQNWWYLENVNAYY